jgi:hypothetical protein
MRGADTGGLVREPEWSGSLKAEALVVGGIAQQDE